MSHFTQSSYPAFLLWFLHLRKYLLVISYCSLCCDLFILQLAVTLVFTFFFFFFVLNRITLVSRGPIYDMELLPCLSSQLVEKCFWTFRSQFLPFIQATPGHYAIGLKILNQLISEMNQVRF